MSDTANVTHLRVTRIAACVHDDIPVIGSPAAFAQRLADPQPVRDLPVTLPFAPGLKIDTNFWARIAEKPRLTAPIAVAIAPKLRRAGIPLRYRGTLDTAADLPRLEAHLHPYGIVALSTVDWHWSVPVPLDTVWQEVNEREDQAATVTVGSSLRTTTLGEAADAAVQALVDHLTEPARGNIWEAPSHRITTVISGSNFFPTNSMPPPNTPLHVALHRLASGDEIMAEPATAFVAQWTNAGYAWPVNSMLYMLSQGSSVFSQEALYPTPGEYQLSTSDRHRRHSLLVAYLTAAIGLIRAARQTPSPYLREWAGTAAKRLGVLFGPGDAFLEWGQVPRALLLRTGAVEAVAQLRGAPLTPNPYYEVPAYH